MWEAVRQDIKFVENIQKNQESLLRSLNQRIGALKIVCNVFDCKTGKMITDGIMMSKLTYLIVLWGGCAKYLLDSLQTAQNRAARVVTKLNWETSAVELLKQCGWLSVHQMVVYHSVMLVYKVIQKKSPQYLYSMFSAEYSYKTKQYKEGLIKQTGDFRLETTEDSFR